MVRQVAHEPLAPAFGGVVEGILILVDAEDGDLLGRLAVEQEMGGQVAALEHRHAIVGQVRAIGQVGVDQETGYFLPAELIDQAPYLLAEGWRQDDGVRLVSDHLGIAFLERLDGKQVVGEEADIDVERLRFLTCRLESLSHPFPVFAGTIVGQEASHQVLFLRGEQRGVDVRLVTDALSHLEYLLAAGLGDLAPVMNDTVDRSFRDAGQLGDILDGDAFVFCHDLACCF